MKKHKGITVDGKRWIPTIQDWSWIITIVWMTAANFYSPFGLFGFVCMFSPVLIALSGRGKMHCARICPRGSLIGKIGSVVNLGLPRPKLYEKPWFRPLLWSGMMGGFAVMLILVIPQGAFALGRAVLIFMEVATVLAILNGVLFTPRQWCTICPMGFTSENLRDMRKKLSKT
nr:4Fe-4S binding protein [uncultured Ruminococcus sp.]